MSGGASILALPTPEPEEVSSRKTLKDYYKKKTKEEEEEEERKRKEEEEEKNKVIPPRPLMGSNRGSY